MNEKVHFEENQQFHAKLPPSFVYVPNYTSPATSQSDLINLISFYHRVRLGNRVPSRRLIIVSATMLVRVSVHRTKGVTTAALETCKPNTLPA